MKIIVIFETLLCSKDNIKDKRIDVSFEFRDYDFYFFLFFFDSKFMNTY